MNELQALGEIIKVFSMIFELEIPVINSSLGTILLWMSIILLLAMFLGHIFGLRGGNDRQ